MEHVSSGPDVGLSVEDGEGLLALREEILAMTFLVYCFILLLINFFSLTLSAQDLILIYIQGSPVVGLRSPHEVPGIKQGLVICNSYAGLPSAPGQPLV